MAIIIISTVAAACLIAATSIYIYRPIKKPNCIGDYKWLQEKEF